MRDAHLRTCILLCVEQLLHVAALARAASAGPEPQQAARHLVDGVRELAPVLAQLRRTISPRRPK